ncbi:MAG: phosphatidylserine decarboxylase-domain-containing protein [Monoraphidium minutum]|nr:MAG: phosphatidylserine decarboxylase-domain-containing protein [Monoraphidium minutum]
MGAALSSFSSFEATHCLVERATGARTPLSKTLRTYFLYSTWLGCLLLQLPIMWWLLSWEHRRIASFANSPRSKGKIAGMIKAYRISVDDAARPVQEYRSLQEHRSLQDFFTRELKPGARPIAEPSDPSGAVQPADSRVVAFPSAGEAKRLWIKGRGFSVPALLGPGYSPADWQECSILVSRLSPADCHRLHAPVTGRVAKISRQGARFMSSLWVAVHSTLDVMVENERLVMEFDSEAFGPVVMVMIGASDVGTVQPLVKEGAAVAKGDEVGVFEFGGSIVATAFRRGAIEFDADLLAHTRRCCETRVKLGSSLGRAAGGMAGAPAGGAAE